MIVTRNEFNEGITNKIVSSALTKKRRLNFYLEKIIEKSFKKVFRQWKNDFLKFYEDNNVAGYLYAIASDRFPNRRIEIEKEFHFISPSDIEHCTDYGSLLYNIDVNEYLKHVYDDYHIHNYGIDLYTPYIVVKGKDPIVENVFVDFSFNEGILLSAFLSNDILVANMFGGYLLRWLKLNETFSLQNKEILRAIKSRANKLVGRISDRVFNEIKDIIMKGFFIEGKHPIFYTSVDGKKLTPISLDIEKYLDGNIKRSIVTARTEIAVIQGQILYEFNKRSNINRHGWLATVGKPVLPREMHQLNHKHIVTIGDPFPSGQFYVGEGSARLVVNCRCSNFSVVEDIKDIKAWSGF